MTITGTNRKYQLLGGNLSRAATNRSKRRNKSISECLGQRNQIHRWRKKEEEEEEEEEKEARKGKGKKINNNNSSKRVRQGFVDNNT